MKRDSMEELLWRDMVVAEANAERAMRLWAQRELRHSLRINARIAAAPSRHWVARLFRRIGAWL